MKEADSMNDVYTADLSYVHASSSLVFLSYFTLLLPLNPFFQIHSTRFPIYKPPNNQAAAITSAIPDPPPTALATAAPVDDALALALLPLRLVAVALLLPLPPLPDVVVNELGGNEVLVAGALVFCTVI